MSIAGRLRCCLRRHPTISPIGAVRMGSTLIEPHVPVEKAIVAMGCFWGVESLYGATPGVIRTRVGFTGGEKISPSYKSLDGHTEAVEVEYDPTVIDYNGILNVFWKGHDPTVQYKPQYMSAIFYLNDQQRNLAEVSMSERQEELSNKIVTKILPASTFYNAEDYHQKYRLQGHRDLMKWLKEAGMKDLIKCHAAARLNGYLGGEGTLEQLQKENLGVPQKCIDYVVDLIKRGAIAPSCH